MTTTPADSSGPTGAGAPQPDPDAPQEGKPDEPGLMIVGIGASAGGLAVIKRLLAQAPQGVNAAYVVVVHLSPDRESHLADLLQVVCPMPVRQVTETTALEPDCVYVIPPNANLNAIDTHLRLSQLERSRQARAPIDHFFRTLAHTHDGHSIAVVLSGTGSDGTLGLRAVKDHGGVSIVQAPEEAEYDGMPRSAIGAGVADLVSPIDEMPAHIARISRTRPRLSDIEQATRTVEEEGERDLQKVFAIVRAGTGHDFTQYKRSTILRRVARRMQLHQAETLPQYLEILRTRPDEVHRLFDDLLITVTEFFRDPETFAFLEQSVIPRLLAGKGPDDRVRVWSVGCSTGEEAYSLAMLLLEAAGERAGRAPRIQVFASDLHEHSLKRARDGVYPDSIASSVSADRLARWFVHDDSTYRVRREVREAVIFAPHDLLRDPPFSHLDLIVCRNVLIYLQREVQQDVAALFHYALRPGGLLLLGSAETFDGVDAFAPEDKQHRLYASRGGPAREPRTPVFPLVPSARLSNLPHVDGAPRPPSGYGPLHARMAEQYAPPSVLVSPSHDIVHYSARAGRFLTHPGGEQTSNVFKLVPEPLRLELRAALQAAADRDAPVRSRPIGLTLDGEPRQVIISARMAADPAFEGYALVMFDEVDEPTVPPPPDTGDATIAELRGELELTRQRLRRAVDEFEAGQEEMQASNEELQSTNEELRSTLEELETSKEELQSMNEELSSVNQENRHRVEELSQLSNDLQNLLAATDIATIFLDRQLRIVRFTPQVTELSNIRPTDRGRPLTDLTHHLGDTSLPHDARRVLDKLVPAEREIRSEQGRWYLTRVLPYRTSDDHIGGVVITLVDITTRRQAEDDLRASKERYRTLFESMDEGFCVVEIVPGSRPGRTDLALVEANPAFERIAGAPGAAGRTLADVMPQAQAQWLEHLDGVAATGHPARFQCAGPRANVLEVYAFGVGDPAHRRVAALITDVTTRSQAERDLQELEVRVTNRTEQLRRQAGRMHDMARRIASAEHAERTRLAAILHDELQQYLVALKMQLAVAATDAAPPAAAPKLQTWADLVENALAASRNLTYRLRPPVLDGEGLAPALRWLAHATSQWYGLDVAIDEEDLPVDLGEDLQGVLFDTVRELLLNIVKHAGVSAASIRVRRIGSRLAVAVSDQGSGFDAEHAAEGYGLRSVRERIEAVGGSLDVESTPGAGATVTLSVPMALRS